MKKIINKSLILACSFTLVTCLVQCKKIDETSIREGSSDPVEITFAVSPQGTKSVISDDGSGLLDFKWQSTDKIYVYDGTKYCGVLSLKSGDGSVSACFGGSISVTSGAANLKFFYFGSDIAAPTTGSTIVDFSSQRGTTEWIQNHLVASCSAPYSEGMTSFSGSFNVAFAIGKFSFSSNDFSDGDYIYVKGMNQKITISSDGSLEFIAPEGIESSKVSYLPEQSHYIALLSSSTNKKLSFYNNRNCTKGFSNPVNSNFFYRAKDGGNIPVILIDVRPLTGEFTVSADGKKVKFSKGNLQYLGTGDGTKTPQWCFAEHQYDIMGGSTMPGNVSIEGYKTYNTGSKSAGGSETNDDKMAARDLFGWGTTGFKDTRSNTYQTNFQPYSTSLASVGSSGINYYGYGPDYDSTNKYGLTVASKSDWGYCFGDETSVWRTLSGGSSGEWKYLLVSRTGDQAPEIGTQIDARYAQVKVNGTPGLLVFPDVFTWPTEVTTIPTTFNKTSSTWNGIIYSTDDFAKLESAGCVFLPTSGIRNGDTIASVAGYGYYWSSTGYNANNAYLLFIGSDGVSPENNRYRYCGCSVRLVIDAQ